MSMHEKLQKSLCKAVFGLMLFILLPIRAECALQQSIHTAAWIPPRDGSTFNLDSLPIDTDYPVFDTRSIYFDPPHQKWTD